MWTTISAYDINVKILYIGQRNFTDKMHVILQLNAIQKTTWFYRPLQLTLWRSFTVKLTGTLVAS